MSRMKTDYIFSTVRKNGVDSEAVRRAIDAVQEAVRVSNRSHTSKIKKAQAAYIEALNEAVERFSRPK
ncbi:hypothetical protein F4054_20730 [Candidatus Poribacteria bacterium]|nr:hypothetical protein [Candidatus Poribacteria bacterium]MYK24673.1 hypothetical protein [Candidatus Poribacteria bacterium]